MGVVGVADIHKTSNTLAQAIMAPKDLPFANGFSSRRYDLIFHCHAYFSDGPTVDRNMIQTRTRTQIYIYYIHILYIYIITYIYIYKFGHMIYLRAYARQPARVPREGKGS